MFGWLANLMLKTPVQGGCSCCEGKREKLEKMRQQIEKGELDAPLSEKEESHACASDNCAKVLTVGRLASGSLHLHYSADGKVYAEIHPAKEEGDTCGKNCQCDGNCRCGN